MFIIKQKILTTLIFILSSTQCFAEGQAGMAEFYTIIYILTFIFYTTIGGILLLTGRKLLGYSNTPFSKLICFIIALGLATVFYFIDDFYFIPIFWFD